MAAILAASGTGAAFSPDSDGRLVRRMPRPHLVIAMSRTRHALTLLLVIAAAAATIALAWSLTSVGVPIWQSAIGPLLLVALLVVHWRRKRS
jgi:hypothetical protein